MKFNLPSKILIATANKGKLAEIDSLLQKINLRTVGTAQFSVEEPEENGNSFAENSLIKARYYAEKTGMTALADDSGLCIDVLQGKPGIYSARWAKDLKNQTIDFSIAFLRIIQLLKELGINPEQDLITAYFVCNLCLYNPQSKENHSFEGRINGIITWPARGNRGFGYDPIFIPNGYTQTFGEMDPLLKEQISHRNQAFQKLLNNLAN